jgi:hypothetical protein
MGETAWWGYLFFKESAFPRNKHLWNTLAVMLLLNLDFPLGHLCLLPFFTRKNRQIMTLVGSGITPLFCYVYRDAMRGSLARPPGIQVGFIENDLR